LRFLRTQFLVKVRRKQSWYFWSLEKSKFENCSHAWFGQVLKKF